MWAAYDGLNTILIIRAGEMIWMQLKFYIFLSFNIKVVKGQKEKNISWKVTVTFWTPSRHPHWKK